MSIQYTSIIILVVFFFLSLPHSILAQATGVIEGQVVMSGEASLTTELEVELLFLPNGQGPPVITSQPLASDGVFSFSDVDTAPQHRYLVRVKVDGEDNFSDLLDFAPNETSKQVTLRLFERTTDTSLLSLQEVNYILHQQAGAWTILALYRYQNDGQQTILNLTNPPAFLPLPAEAASVQFVEGIQPDSVVELADGFAYNGPFAPGELSMIYSYLYPYNEGSQTLTLPLGSDSGVIRVLIPKLGQTTSTDDMRSVGEREFEGITFDIFEQVAPKAGELFTFRFEQLPKAPTPEPVEADESRPLPGQSTIAPISPLERLPWWAPLVPMSAVILLTGGYIIARPAPTSAETLATLRNRRDTLVAEIATLDIRFESGAIGEQTHRRQRHALKQELKEILRHKELKKTHV